MAQSVDEPLVAYSLPQYLLDRINIHDTITRLVSNRPALFSTYSHDRRMFCNSQRILIAETLNALGTKSLPPQQLQ